MATKQGADEMNRVLDGSRDLARDGARRVGAVVVSSEMWVAGCGWGGRGVRVVYAWDATRMWLMMSAGRRRGRHQQRGLFPSIDSLMAPGGQRLLSDSQISIIIWPPQ